MAVERRRGMAMGLASLLLGSLLGGPAHASGGGGKTEATVYCKNAAPSSCSLSLGTLDTSKGSAWGTFEDTLNTTGWGVLNIKTRPHAAGAAGLAYFAAGMVEGGLSAARMVDAERNMVETISHRTEAKAAAFLEEQAAWVGSMVRQHGDGDPFWTTVGAEENCPPPPPPPPPPRRVSGIMDNPCHPPARRQARWSSSKRGWPPATPWLLPGSSCPSSPATTSA